VGTWWHCGLGRSSTFTTIKRLCESSSWNQGSLVVAELKQRSQQQHVQVFDARRDVRTTARLRSMHSSRGTLVPQVRIKRNWHCGAYMSGWPLISEWTVLENVTIWTDKMTVHTEKHLSPHVRRWTRIRHAQRSKYRLQQRPFAVYSSARAAIYTRQVPEVLHCACTQ
jgi:hypothetical protein